MTERNDIDASGSRGASRPRGRPRSAAARAKILAAARALMEEGGVASVTMEAVAARAGVGKPTVYRSWPNAHAVAMAALIDTPAPAADAGEMDALGALRAQLRAVAGRFATPMGRSAAQLVAASTGETEISRAFRHHVMLKSRAAGRALLAQAAEEGTIRSGLDVEAVLDLLYGALFFRLLMGHAPLDEAAVDTLVDHALAGVSSDRTGGP